MSELTRYRLSDLYELSSGISSKPEQAGHGYPFCSFSTVFNNAYLPDELPDLMDTSDKEREIYSIKAGDVFLTRTSETVDELCMSSVAVKDYPNATYSGFLKRLRPISDKAYPKFMALFFRSRFFRKTVTNKAVMTLRASFNEAVFNDISVDLPPIEDQRRIGDLFYDVECKTRNNNAIISELEAMAKVIYDYWFVQFDFPDANGKPYRSSGGKMVWNEDLKREIPEGWKPTCFGDLFSFVKGRIPEELSETPTDSCSSPYLTIDVANDGNPQYCNPSSMVYCDGQVVMVMDGAASGDVYLGNKGSLGSTFSMLPSKRKDISNALLFMLLQSNMAVYKKANTGSTVPHANRSFIERMKTALPDKMSSFEITFDQIFEYIISLRSENRELKSLRDWLLPMLMNGQVKVGQKEFVYEQTPSYMTAASKDETLNRIGD